MTDPRESRALGSTQWVWRGIALGALLLGWIFIAWQNHFHITAPAVFVCLAYLAVVTTVYNLWRTGAAAVAGDEEADSTWAKQTGALGELEREKRTLLKAIKEAEFDHQMGKLSKHDADEMIRVYRARAIEVIKESDQVGTGAAGTPREQIMREVRARLELDAKAGRKAAEPAKAATADGAPAGKGKKRGKGAAKADAAKADAAKAEAAGAAASSAAASSVVANGEASADAKAKASADALEAATSHPGHEPSNATDAEREPAAEAGEVGEHAAPSGAAALDDEAMNADSTTAVDSTRNHRAKEATP